MGIPAYLEKRPRSFWALAGVMLVILNGALDTLTGYEWSFSLFYLIPIFFSGWYAGRRAGVIMAMYSAFVWLAADVLAGHEYSHPAIQYWNASVRFGFFLTTALLVSALREALENEKQLSRTDSLTGAVNTRHFDILLRQEMDRSSRYGHPYTLVYVDLDNFKTVNDAAGHSEGDKVLSAVVMNARKQLRTVDVVARVGGDEFVLLLPETDPHQAKACVTKLQRALLEEMQRHNWPVTFSIGVLTVSGQLRSTDELIGQADQLMYDVKRNGKNAIRYSTLGG